MKSTNYQRGRRFEYQVAVALREMGFDVIRSAGSHTPADLVALCPTATLLVQCKTSMSLFPAGEQEKLRQLLARSVTQGLLAYKVRLRGKMQFLHLRSSGQMEGIAREELCRLARLQKAP